MDLVQYQLAFFFKIAYKNPIELFILKVKNVFPGFISTTQMPIGENDPPEIPRAILNYDGYTINIAKSRIDIIVGKIVLAEELQRKLNAVEFSSLGIEIIRIGLIKTYFAEDKSIENLKTMLNSNLNSKAYKELNIRMNLPFDKDGLLCNDIEKYDPGEAEKNHPTGNLRVAGIVIQKDINSDENYGIPMPTGMRYGLITCFSEKADNFYASGSQA